MSHSPRRLKGRAGSARSKPLVENRGFSRRPRAMPGGLVVEALQLADRVEDDLVGIAHGLGTSLSAQATE
jgi:hypothetical protein